MPLSGRSPTCRSPRVCLLRSVMARRPKHDSAAARNSRSAHAADSRRISGGRRLLRLLDEGGTPCVVKPHQVVAWRVPTRSATADHTSGSTSRRRRTASGTLTPANTIWARRGGRSKPVADQGARSRREQCGHSDERMRVHVRRLTARAHVGRHRCPEHPAVWHGSWAPPSWHLVTPRPMGLSRPAGLVFREQTLPMTSARPGSRSTRRVRGSARPAIPNFGPNTTKETS
jgi:hypothetical protein